MLTPEIIEKLKEVYLVVEIETEFGTMQLQRKLAGVTATMVAPHRSYHGERFHASTPKLAYGILLDQIGKLSDAAPFGALPMPVAGIIQVSNLQ